MLFITVAKVRGAMNASFVQLYNGRSPSPTVRFLRTRTYFYHGPKT